MYEMRARAGQWVIQEGEPGDRLFVVAGLVPMLFLIRFYFFDNILREFIFCIISLSFGITNKKKCIVITLSLDESVELKHSYCSKIYFRRTASGIT